MPRTLAQKLWDSHVVRSAEGEPDGASGTRAGRAPGVRELFNQAFTRVYETEVARLRRGRQ